MCKDQLAENIVSETTDVMVNVINQAYSNCASASVQSETQTVSGNDGSTIILGKNDFYETASELVQCETTADFDSNISTEISQAAQQAAEDINASLDPFGGDEEAVNVTNITANLATTVVDTYNQSCTYATLQTQSQDVIDNYDSTIIIGCTTFDEELDVMNQCILQATAVQDIQNELQQAVSQSASNKQSSLLLTLILIVAVVFVIVVIVAVIGGIIAVRNYSKNKTPDSDDPSAVITSAIQAKAKQPSASAPAASN